MQAITQAAKELVEQRDRWLNAEGLSEAEKKKRTLTNLFNQRTTWLELAHKRLDVVLTQIHAPQQARDAARLANPHRTLRQKAQRRAARAAADAPVG